MDNSTIYAYYGLGKTTLATAFPYLFYDDDRFVPDSVKEPYTGQPIILTNDPTRKCQLYFLPENRETNRLVLEEQDKLAFFDEYEEDGQTLLDQDFFQRHYGGCRPGKSEQSITHH